MSAFLTIPEAIQFRQEYDWNNISKKCKERIIEFRSEIHQIINTQSMIGNNPKDWLGQMYSFQVQYEDFIKLKNIFINDYKIEIPIMRWEDKTLIRISLNGYNSENDIEKLLNVMKTINSN